MFGCWMVGGLAGRPWIGWVLAALVSFGWLAGECVGSFGTLARWIVGWSESESVIGHWSLVG